MTDDFVARLRIRWEAMGDMANDERAAAATEIDALRQSQRSLMAQVAALTETLRIVNDGMAESLAEDARDDELHERMDDILTRTANALHGQALKDGLISWHDLPERAERLRNDFKVAQEAHRDWRMEATRCRQERDAARREVCAHLSSESALLAIRRTPEEIAASRGWLCFPPEPKETP